MPSTSVEEEFLYAVEDYCRWIEFDELGASDSLEVALGHLGALYFSARKLKETEDFDYPKFKELSHDDWKRIHNRLGMLPFQYCNEFFHPTNLNETDAVVGDICDDLADIYVDLKNDLILQKSTTIEAASHYWKINYEIHWGRHAVSAMYAIHCHIADTVE